MSTRLESMTGVCQQRLVAMCHVTKPCPPRLGISGTSITIHGKRCTSSSSRERRVHRCAIHAQEGEEFQGVYGPWRVEQSDLIEVWTYRICISILTASCVTESVQHGLALSLPVDDEIVCLAGIAALGIALQQIHIYVTPLKRMLQLFWLAGFLGYGYVSLQNSGQGLTTMDAVLKDGSTVWLVGPLGAALTGVTFKEGLCYGKTEAFILTLLIPALFLSHLFGFDGSFHGAVGQALDLSVCGLLSLFALRKYTQDVKDDIGDGSVFRFQKMTPHEQEELLKTLE